MKFPEYLITIFIIFMLFPACDYQQEITQERGYPKSPEGVVNINTASKEELMRLPFINEQKAQNIIDWRSKHPFKKVEEIIYVPYIGEYTYLKLRKYLVVEGETTLQHSIEYK